MDDNEEFITVQLAMKMPARVVDLLDAVCGREQRSRTSFAKKAIYDALKVWNTEHKEVV